MITKDPYGVAGAVRAWDGIYAGRLEHKPKRKYNQKEIDMCLTCTLDMAECHGNCTKKRKDPKPPGDPCRQCYSREICHRIGGTCGEKERWTDDRSKNQNEENAEILQMVQSFSCELGRRKVLLCDERRMPERV